jgi:hypothetical protein
LRCTFDAAAIVSSLLIRNVVVTFSVAVAATLELPAYRRSAAELRKPQLYQYIRGLSNNSPRKRADFQRKIAGPAIYDDIEADILKRLMPARSDAVPNGALRCFRQTSSLVEGDPNVGTLPWMPSSRT